ncbi:MAG: S-methyl-5-thioribose-1-phosphate isomerase [Candidatus Methanomethylicia archaeon]
MKAITWNQGKVRFVDQSKLPLKLEYIETENPEEIVDAIRKLRIRGAPSIGVAGALTIALIAYHSKAENIKNLAKEITDWIDKVKKVRPTAKNLFYALNRLENIVNRYLSNNVNKLKSEIINEALNIMIEECEYSKKVSEIASQLIEDNDAVLTHCNTGPLATVDYGTALGAIMEAWRQGKRFKVIITETRPLLQGSRITAFELKTEGIPFTLITDNMVGFAMQKRMINKVIVGADRILRAGHVINKIGTYTLAVLAHEHGIPFYVVAPTTTIDISSNIEDIIIEERESNEVTSIMGYQIAPPDVNVWNPAFDITPPRLVSMIITEKGIIRPPFKRNIKNIVSYSKIPVL